MTSQRATPTERESTSARLRTARLSAFLNPGVETPPADGVDRLTGLIARTAAIYKNSLTPETRTTYGRRWRLFEAWCRDEGLVALPADPETVMLYIAATVSSDGAALSTIRGWMAAINRVHREAGLAPPGDDPAMGMFLRGLARTHPPSQRSVPMSALRIADLRDVCRHLESVSHSPAAIRDAGILALHQMALSDGEVSRLDWRDLMWTEAGVEIEVGPSRPGRHTRVLHAAKSTQAGSVYMALAGWRQTGFTDRDPVFTQIHPDGWQEGQRLTPRAIFKIRKSRLTSLADGDEMASVQEAIIILSGPSSEVLRDRAVLLLGFAGAFRRGEVTRLTWSDVRSTDAGLIIHLARSKTDMDGRGRDVGIPTGKSELTCPTRALLAWKERVAQQLSMGAAAENTVFTHVGRSGRITDRPLSPEGLTRLVFRRAHQAGVDGRWGGRSLRAGFISTAADLDIPLEAIARQSRHKTLDSLIRYIRDDPFRRNPASQVGL